VTKLKLPKYEVMSSPAIVRLVSQRITNRNVVNICSIFNQYAVIDIKTPVDIKSPVNINTRHASSGSKSPVHMMGLGKAVSRKERTNGPRKPRSKIRSLSRADMIDPDTTDWSSVYDAAQSYNPSVVPLPIRMGRPRSNRIGDIPPNDKGNIELLKIPNFFHLTPPAIKKHCEALKEYCTPWPAIVNDRLVRITTINFLYSGPSIRHPDSRKVKLQIYLKDLDLNEHARQKLMLLVGDRYNPSNDELTIITDRCPTRKQNKEYAYYLLAALYHESWKTEEWEQEAEGKTFEELQEDVDSVKSELDPKLQEIKSKNRRRYRIVNDKVVRYNNVGHPFVMENHRFNIKGGLTEDEKQLAKHQWEVIKKDLPDEDSFDPFYRRSTESEFTN